MFLLFVSELSYYLSVDVSTYRYTIHTVCRGAKLYICWYEYIPLYVLLVMGLSYYLSVNMNIYVHNYVLLVLELSYCNYLFM